MKHFCTQFLTTILLLFGIQVQYSTAQTFSNEVPMPYLMTGNSFEIDIAGGLHNFDPNGSVSDIDINQSLETYCYNKTGQPANERISYLGPTLVFTKSELHEFTISNNLPDNANTTVHWHGLNIPGEMDGGPHQVIENGTAWSPYFTIIDQVQTVWYHTHLMDLTTDQVIRGLAGLIIVEDPENDPLYSQLPTDYGENDFPIVIQEKGFVLDSTTSPPTATAIIAGEKPGNGPYTLINGVVGGYIKVPAEIVRLRVLNGSPRKMYHIGLSTELHSPASFTPMWMIATSGGYIDYPRATDSTLMSCGDRREFLIDFAQFNDGDTIYMSNLSVPSDANYGKTPGSAHCAFVVDHGMTSRNPLMDLPSYLVDYELSHGEVFRTREKRLMGSGGSGNVWTIDNTPMDMMVINDTVLVNTKERWIIHNETNKSHPFHIHKVQFQVVEYSGKVGVVDTAGTYLFPDLPDELLGYKDVQLIRPGATMIFEARFDSFPGPLQPNMGYMYHCHILTHEDTSMMHQFVVVDSADYFVGIHSHKSKADLSVYPNPASTYFTINETFKPSATLRLYDAFGRFLREEEVVSNGNIIIDVSDLPRGMIMIEIISDNKQYIGRVMVN